MSPARARPRACAEDNKNVYSRGPRVRHPRVRPAAPRRVPQPADSPAKALDGTPWQREAGRTTRGGGGWRRESNLGEGFCINYPAATELAFAQIAAQNHADTRS